MDPSGKTLAGLGCHFPYYVATFAPRLPDRLLRAPWTEEKLDLVQFLSMGAAVNMDDTFGRSDALYGQLIRDREFAVFQRLASMRFQTVMLTVRKRWPIRLWHLELMLEHADEQNDPFIRHMVYLR